MKTILTATMLALLALAAFTPVASATPHNACAPENVVCVVQDDSPYAGADCDAEPYNYGGNADTTEVVADVDVARANAGGSRMCNNFHYADGDYVGLHATAAAGDATAEAYWRSYDIDYHWHNAPEDRHGEYVVVRANDGTEPTGVHWQRDVTPTEGTDTCDTTLTIQGTATHHGCPLGNPPAPPAVEWGHVLP